MDINSEHAKRTWHAGKPKKKTDYNSNTVTEGLIASVTDLYLSGISSLHAICEDLPDLHLNPMKVRKLLITAGVYEGRERTADIIEAVNQLHKEGNSVPQIAAALHRKRLNFRYDRKNLRLLFSSRSTLAIYI